MPPSYFTDDPTANLPNDWDTIIENFQHLREPLGALVMEFAHLEDATTETINALMRLSYPEGAILEALMQNFSLTIELFNTMAQLHANHDDLKRLATKISRMLHQANADRNNLIHDAWGGYSPQDNAFSKIRYRVEDGKLKQINVLHHITVKDAENVVAFVKRVALALSHWRACFIYGKDDPSRWPRPLPEKFYAGSPLRSRAHDRKTKESPRPHRSSPT
jgi:hypothetical protein